MRKNRDEEDDLLDDRDLSDDENGMHMPPMDGSEAFHQVVKDMLVNGHQVKTAGVTTTIVLMLDVPPTLVRKCQDFFLVQAVLVFLVVTRYHSVPNAGRFVRSYSM